MTLEEKLRALAAKGELVHISIAFRDGLFYANFAAASPPGGYARESDKDPVVAVEKALASSPVKIRRSRGSANQEREPEPEITAAVNDEREFRDPFDTGFPTDWTKP